MDCKKNLQKFFNARGNANNGSAGFDFCYNYFQNFKSNDSISKLGDPMNIQIACAQLGQYLANWGMYRGSAFIKRNSMLVYKDLIVEISREKWRDLWFIDIDNYTQNNIEMLIAFGNQIEKLMVDNSFSEKEKISKPSVTLKTKIMLGIFGNVPAFDRFFLNGFKETNYHITGLNNKSLNSLKSFYSNNNTFIDNQKIQTYDFDTKEKGSRLYSKSKIVDIIGFYETIESQVTNKG